VGHRLDGVSLRSRPGHPGGGCPQTGIDMLMVVMAEESPSSGMTPKDRPGGGGGGGSGGGSGSGSGGSNGGGSNRNRNRNRNRSRNRGGGGQGQNRPGVRSGNGGNGNGGNGGGRSRSGQGSRPGGGQSGRTRTSAPRATGTAPEVLTPLIIEPGLGAAQILPAEVAANRRRAVMLCERTALVPALVVGLVIGLVLSPVIGAAAFVVVAVGVGFGLWRVAPAVALRRIGAVPLPERDHQRLVNVTEGLCATFGLRMPTLFIVFDAVPNACVLGRNPASADLVVTSGLLDTMGPIELEGVIAHELAHVKRGDNDISSIALALSRFGGESMLRRCVGESREYRADVVGASAVHYPRGLLDALRLMIAAPPPVGNSVFNPDRMGATRWVWIDPSVGQRGEPMPVGDLNATSVRAAALSEW